MKEDAETPASRRQKTDSLAAAWAQEEGVAPKGQKDNPEAVWTRWGGATGRWWLSRKPQHIRGTGDLSGEVTEMKTARAERALGGPLPPPLDLTWCVGITGAEGVRGRDSRLWRSLWSSWSFP